MHRRMVWHCRSVDAAAALQQPSFWKQQLLGATCMEHRYSTFIVRAMPKQQPDASMVASVRYKCILRCEGS